MTYLKKSINFIIKFLIYFIIFNIVSLVLKKFCGFENNTFGLTIAIFAVYSLSEILYNYFNGKKALVSIIISKLYFMLLIFAIFKLGLKLGLVYSLISIPVCVILLTSFYLAKEWIQGSKL
jgi:hypothetical protein